MSAFDNLPSSLEHIRSGKLRALAVTTATRSMADAGPSADISHNQVHRGCESTKTVVPQQFADDSRSAPMPTECNPDFFGFEPVEGRAVVAAFDAGAISSDAGALLLGATD